MLSILQYTLVTFKHYPISSWLYQSCYTLVTFKFYLQKGLLYSMHFHFLIFLVSFSKFVLLLLPLPSYRASFLFFYILVYKFIFFRYFIQSWLTKLNFSKFYWCGHQHVLGGILVEYFCQYFTYFKSNILFHLFTDLGIFPYLTCNCLYKHLLFSTSFLLSVSWPDKKSTLTLSHL